VGKGKRGCTLNLKIDWLLHGYFARLILEKSPTDSNRQEEHLAKLAELHFTL
jgi:hypothetical protein